VFLKSLTMKGFKSFADPTVLEFEPGITVVVGPNGSGKSNVVDAVTWVLGAQGPRSLRSQKMEDVIFAGTTSRPALGRAEVSLTIDNSSGKLPLDMAEVTISRTLFRSGESEYAINRAPCRLLDIQELLSDSGVGRQQHMIVGQGQLDTVLNARPEDRRAIVEEAAGVLKHRRRRERAERRLAGTQENLERLGDLVREVRRQIRPLERQAAAARSHAALADELRAVRRHLAGVELGELRARRESAADALSALSDEARDLESQLGELDAAAGAATAELSSRREEDLGGALGRVQALIERTRGSAGVLRERTRSLDAALDAAADVDVVSTLEADAARLASELESSAGEEESVVPELASSAEDEAALRADEEAHAARFGSDEPTAAESALQRAVVRQAVLAGAVEHATEARRAFAERLGGLEARAAELNEQKDRRSSEEHVLAAEGDRLASAASAASADAAAAAERAEEAETAARDAEQQRHRSAARAEALERALRDLEGSGGREVLAGVAGVVGSLVDLVEIDPGWEAAFEAAAGASVAAVVVDGREAARAALARLHGQGATGALLAAGQRGHGSTSSSATVPEGAEALRPHVRRHGSAGASVDAVLDALVGHAVRVGGWERAIDVALDHPELVVVTVEGDRFALSGWRVRAPHDVVTAAAVEDAHRRADDAARAADEAGATLGRARADADRTRAASFAALRAADQHAASIDGSRAALARIVEESQRIGHEIAAARTGADETARRLSDEESELATVSAEVPSLEAAVASAAERAADAAAGRELLEGRRRALAAVRTSLDVRLAGLQERRRVLETRQADVERRLSGHSEEREVAASRRRRLENDRRAVERLGEVVEDERLRLEALFSALQTEYQNQLAALRASGERLEQLRLERGDVERRLAQVREQTRGLDVEVTEVDLRTETLVESARRDLGAEPAELGEDAVEPDFVLPEGVSAAQHAERLDRELASLGPVNPLALEELSALEERHRELDTQVADVRAARRELQDVVRMLDAEIMETFSAAVADVSEHFSALVELLFPGGTGRLSLTDPEDLLNTGVEVEVRPAGRNVRRVSLLSGGERALAALAFLFAVFRSRPSPFYLMDEVEAALDDVNLHRFLALVREFRDEAQLIIVSHQKRTMETGDALYGVTMAPGGSSQVVSQRVARREQAEAS